MFTSRRASMKAFHKTWLLLIVFASLYVCSGTAWSAEFVRTYGGTGTDVGVSVSQTADGGFLAAGSTDSVGAGSFDLWILRTDFEGNVIWEKTYGGNTIEYLEFAAIRETSDRGIVVAGASAGLGVGGMFDGWLVRLEGTGQVLWEKSYGGAMNDFLFRLIEVEGGRFIAVGLTGSFGSGGGDAWVLWIDEHGQVTQEMAYGGPGEELAVGASLTKAGLLLGGTTNSSGAGGRDAWVMLIDPITGAVIWSKSYGGGSDDSFWGVAGVGDGGFVVVGESKSFGAGGADVWVMRLDGNGNPLWEKTYGGTGDDRAWSVVEMDDGNLAVLGNTASFGYGQDDVWLLALDPSGNISREYTYGGSGMEHARDIHTTHDRGLILAGGTGSFATGTADLWLLKVTGEGNIPDPVCVHLFGTSAALATSSAATVGTAMVGAVSSLSSGGVTMADTSAIIMSVGAGLSTTPLCFTGSPVLPQPLSPEIIPYGAVPVASIGPDVFSTSPLGVGDVAGGMLGLNVNIPYFDAPIDVFVGVSSPVLGDEILLVAENGSFQSPSSGPAPWRFETHGGYVANLIGEIPVSSIPGGDYTFYVAVTPPGNWTSYYIWSTTLGLP
jgi:hypothetical protein